MRKRENCSILQFQEMRQIILDTVPYGLLNSEYDDKNQIAYLYLWDSDYVPKVLEPWIVRPVSAKSDKPGVSEEHK